MFISVLDLFKIGIGPSSSHTMGPMVAAVDFRRRLRDQVEANGPEGLRVRVVLKGSLAFTGKGHASDRAVLLGLHGHAPASLADRDVDALSAALSHEHEIDLGAGRTVVFSPARDIVFDRGEPLPEHPNGMVFRLQNEAGETVLEETYFSIGGGFINTRAEITGLVAPLKMAPVDAYPFPFDSAQSMLEMAEASGLGIAGLKRRNEQVHRSDRTLDDGLDVLWQTMRDCVERGLATSGILPGGLKLPRRARGIAEQLRGAPAASNLNEWLCAYAMAVNEENAAGHTVVTAPTNGAAGVIPAVLYYLVEHDNGSREQVRDFLLVAAAIGGIIKHRSSISGAEVGCQGEIGSAAAMAAAGLCAVRGGTPRQVEHAAEIALEHHLGMTCDPVGGLVQVPCIERNGFGAVKAWTAASLALRGTGRHFMPLDNCIAAMRQTGLEMSAKFKETALGGLAVSLTEC